MIIFPNCKINLGLRITEKRADGYHNIETVFHPLPLRDALEIIENTNTSTPQLSVSGLAIPENGPRNLCLRAWELLKTDFPTLPSVDIFLHKAIPTGAGLGGGSADGAFMLKALNEKFSLGISAEKLQAYALQLGSDCPFFILNQPCFASGRGELLTPLSIDLSGYYFAIENPGIHISTAWAFSRIQPRAAESRLSDIVALPVAAWKNLLVNDFEEPVFREYPQIKDIKEKMYIDGAVFASMTGTGSTVFGIFARKPDNYVSLPR